MPTLFGAKGYADTDASILNLFYSTEVQSKNSFLDFQLTTEQLLQLDNLRNDSGQTLLEAAYRGGDHQKFTILLECGASPYVAVAGTSKLLFETLVEAKAKDSSVIPFLASLLTSMNVLFRRDIAAIRNNKDPDHLLSLSSSLSSLSTSSSSSSITSSATSSSSTPSFSSSSPSSSTPSSSSPSASPSITTSLPPSEIDARITQLRMQIGERFSSIRVLDLARCRLRKVPKVVCCLSKVEVLDLSENELVCLPDAIGWMENLTELDCSQNTQIQYLPSSLTQCPKLARLRVNGCQLSSLPEAVKFEYISSNSAALAAFHIREYLRYLSTPQSWRTVKLMFLGQEEVGKTTLLRALSGVSVGSLGPSGNTISTEGIDLCDWKVGKTYFSVWDFGGQTVFYPTHQFFMTDRSIYVLVFSLLSPSLTRIEYWLKKIQTMTTSSPPIIIVASHADAEGVTKTKIDFILSKVRRTFSHRFPMLVDVFAVGSKKKLGLKEVKKCLEKISTRKNFQTKSPAGWSKASQLVAKLKKEVAYMPLREFKLQISGPSGVATKDLPNMLEFFHDAGIVVYFSDLQMGLDRLVILDPEWLAKVLATIVTFSHSCASDGILDGGRLRQVWSGYPQTMWPFLLAILERFEIAYPWLRSPTSPCLIIPSLLPAEPPASLATLWPKEIPFGYREYGRIYQFQFVPLGFFSRLMMRLIRTPGIQIAEGVSWVNGALFSLGRHLALIQSHETDFRISISIREVNHITDLEVDDSNLADHDEAVLMLLYGAKSEEGSGKPEGTATPTKHSQLLKRNFLSLIVGVLEPLLEFSYPSLATTTVRSIPCIHCLNQTSSEAASPYMFDFQDCCAALEKGETLVYCCGLDSRPVRLDALAPDLTFADLPLIENYHILSELGSGGFGTVYKAQITGTDKIVAIKELNFSGQSQQEIAQKMSEFQREARLMAALKSEYLVRLYGISLRPKLRMVIEFINGRDLYHFMHDHSFRADMFPWNSKMVVANDIAAAMEYLHSRNPPVAHADLRSPNVFLEIKRARRSPTKIKSIRAKVADFGLAREVFSHTQGFLNTWQWMAPEVLDPNNQLFDERIDTYSFGIVLWELVTGAFPFDEFEQFRVSRQDDDGVAHHYFKEREIKNAIISQDLRPTLPADLPAEYGKLVQQCWHRTPKQRPSFAAIRMVLAGLLDTDSPSPLSLSSSDWLRSGAASSSSDAIPGVPVPDEAPADATPSSSSSSSAATTRTPRFAGEQPVLANVHQLKDKVQASCLEATQWLWLASSTGVVTVLPMRDAAGGTAASFNLNVPVTSLVWAGTHIWAGLADGMVVVYPMFQEGLSTSGGGLGGGGGGGVAASGGGGTGTGTGTGVGGVVEPVGEVRVFQEGAVTGMQWVIHSSSVFSDSVWAISMSESCLTVVDANSLTVQSSFIVEPEPLYIIQHQKEVWVSAGTLILIFDASKHTPLKNIPCSGLGEVLSLSSVGETVWGCTGDGIVCSWSSRGIPIRSLRTSRAPLRSVVPAGSHLWVGGDEMNLIVVDPQEFVPLFDLQGCSSPIQSLYSLLMPDLTNLLVAVTGEQALLWQLAKCKDAHQCLNQPRAFFGSSRSFLRGKKSNTSRRSNTALPSSASSSITESRSKDDTEILTSSKSKGFLFFRRKKKD